MKGKKMQTWLISGDCLNKIFGHLLLTMKIYSSIIIKGGIFQWEK